MSDFESADPYASYEPSTSALAFSGYHDAWLERQESGDASERLLVDALQRRGVKTHEIPEGSLLRETLWQAWAKNRGPRRIHLTILRYRVRQVIRAPRAVVNFFRSTIPEHLRIPSDVKRISRHGAADEGLTLAFTPAVVFATRLRSEWKGLDAEDDGDGEPSVDLPVWLEPVASRHRASVMLGRERIGEVTLPTDVHAYLLSGPTTRRGVRLVADGTLLAWRDRRSRFHADEVDLIGTPET